MSVSSAKVPVNVMIRAGLRQGFAIGRQDCGAASTPTHFIFAGGRTTWQATSQLASVEGWSSDLSKGVIPDMSLARHGPKAAGNSAYAFVGAGYSTNGNSCDAYSTSLSRVAAPTMSWFGGFGAGTTIGNRAVMGGGSTYLVFGYAVDAYDTSLTRAATGNLSAGKHLMGAAYVGSVGLFAGGWNDSGGSQTTVEVFTSSLGRSTATALSQKRNALATASLPTYALFAGGAIDNDATHEWTKYVPSNTIQGTNIVEAYSSSLSRTTAPALDQTVWFLSGGATTEKAYFGGGRVRPYVPTTSVVSYNTSLTKSIAPGLSAGRYWGMGASQPNNVIFSAGAINRDNSIRNGDSYGKMGHSWASS